MRRVDHRRLRNIPVMRLSTGLACPWWACRTLLVGEISPGARLSQGQPSAEREMSVPALWARSKAWS